jgi:threonine/homoserine/homoserine lactone efflux protein
MLDPVAGSAPGMLAFAMGYALMLAVPGPNFVVVARAALTGSPRIALAATAGVATGAALLATVASAGLSLVAHAGIVRLALTACFAAVLIAAGFSLLLRSVRNEIGIEPRHSGNGIPHFGLGFLTAITNPVTAAFFATAISSTEAATEAGTGPPVGFLVFAIAASWFGLVCLGVSLKWVQLVYLQCWRVLGAAGGVLLLSTGVVAISRVL